MKKILSILMCVLMILPIISISFTSSAVKISAGHDALKTQFQHGEAALDYVYYSPVKNGSDTTKYPLVVWLHGNSSGDYPGHQLDNCNIANWSSEEYQSRFKKTGGAYLLLPRDSTKDIVLAWDGQIPNMKKTVDAFIEEHSATVDTSRIYIGGYSMGGKGAIKAAVKYENFFAAVFPMSPVYNPTNADWKALADTPVWLLTCKNDAYPSLLAPVVKSNWNYLTDVSNVPEKLRWSEFDGIYYPNGELRKNETHNTWEPACYDLFMDNGQAYKDMKTVDGNGNTVKLTYPNGLISWLSSQRLDSVSTDDEEPNFFQKILNFFRNLMDMIRKLFKGN